MPAEVTLPYWPVTVTGTVADVVPRRVTVPVVASPSDQIAARSVVPPDVGPKSAS